MPDGDPARRLLLATPGFELALVQELPASWRPHVVSETPGLVIADEPQPVSPACDPVFARQQLPDAREVRATSVSGLAERCYALVEATIDDRARRHGAFTWHAFAPTGADPGLAGRATLVAEQTLSLLRQRRKRAARAYRLAPQAAPSFGELAVVVQFLLVERERGYLSITAPEPLPHGGWLVAPWPGGIAPVTDDRRPPSRAYRKLEEAFQWMGEAPAPGELCVDLGGAPGGWSYTALRRGARVIAVDRAPLAASLLANPRLTMIVGNAFTYQPAAEVDWLLSDVVCEPARALALIRGWVGATLARKAVVTVKFKGRDGYGVLASVREALIEAGVPRFRIKHLTHNKNEVTVMAAREGSAAAGQARSQPQREPVIDRSFP